MEKDMDKEHSITLVAQITLANGRMTKGMELEFTHCVMVIDTRVTCLKILSKAMERFIISITIAMKANGSMISATAKAFITTIMEVVTKVCGNVMKSMVKEFSILNLETDLKDNGNMGKNLAKE